MCWRRARLIRVSSFTANFPLFLVLFRPKTPAPSSDEPTANL
nr:MAG TPA: hypothetical protein [Caudoviricetes sp.]